MGALDEADPRTPYVVITNYLMARPNCLKAWSTQAICCQNRCEDLQASLEKEVGTPTGPPERIIELVTKMPVEVGGPPPSMKDGSMPDLLRSRLYEIAAIHGGQIPLSSQLFSQWMHHAYPLECPYPMKGFDAEAANAIAISGGTASQEEMKQHVEADTCSVDSFGRPDCIESTDLPWYMPEDDIDIKIRTTGASETSHSLMPAILVSVALAVAAFSAAPLVGKSTSPMKIADIQRARAKVTGLLLSIVAYLSGILNVNIFGFAVFISGVAMASSRYAELMREKSVLPKCV